jgi:nitrate reductase NapE component
MVPGTVIEKFQDKSRARKHNSTGTRNSFRLIIIILHPIYGVGVHGACELGIRSEE